MEQDLVAGLAGAHGAGEAAGLPLRRVGAIDRTCLRLVKQEIDRLQRSHPRAALRVADVTLGVCISIADPACAALGLWAKANALRELGEYDQALSCYDDAGRNFARADQPVEVASTLIGKIDALM